MRFLDQVTDCKWRIRPGFVPNMRVPGTFYVNAALQELVFSELEQFAKSNARQGFLPALKQIANVQASPSGSSRCLHVCNNRASPDLRTHIGTTSLLGRALNVAASKVAPKDGRSDGQSEASRAIREDCRRTRHAQSESNCGTRPRHQRRIRDERHRYECRSLRFRPQYNQPLRRIRSWERIHTTHRARNPA